MPKIAREVYRGHAATRELALEHVAPLERMREPLEKRLLHLLLE